MRESKIESDTCARALAELSVRSLKLNVQGDTGWPDRMYLIPGGRPLFIEFKATGGVRSARQRLIHAMLTYNGYKVETHDTKAEAFAAIKAAVDAATEAGWASQDPARYAAALGAARISKEGGEIPTRPGRRSVVPRPRTGKDQHHNGCVESAEARRHDAGVPGDSTPAPRQVGVAS